MKKLYQVSCSGGRYGRIRDSIYVVADDEKDASDKALNKVKELKYDLINYYVLNVKLIADERDSIDSLLII